MRVPRRCWPPATLPLADRRHHFLAEQFNRAHGRIVRHARLLAVEYQMAHVQLVFEKAKFFQHRVRGAGDNVIVCLQLLDVLLAQGFAFAGAAARRYLADNTARASAACSPIIDIRSQV